MAAPGGLVVSRERARSAWQRDDGCTAAVLHEVFAWLSGRELATAGAACRAWRRAASSPALWRRLVVRAGGAGVAGSWRQQFVDRRAGWRAVTQLGAGAAHAVLAPDGARLALAAADGSLQVWARAAAGWRPAASLRPAERGWRCAVRVQWPAATADRLLALAELALVDSWELLVLHFDESGAAHVTASARCSAGAGGCWAEGAGRVFLSLELSLLAPRLACTTVWTNAAEQETQSEHTGVRAPLMRLFNEDAAHFVWAGVAHAPAGAAVLVAAWGAKLGAWPLAELQPPPVRAAELGDLRERVRMRALRPPPAEDVPPPDEATVRALCVPPAATCALPAPPVGFIVETSGRRVWVTLSHGGAWCAELPSLRALHHLPPPGGSLAPDPTVLHYVQPDISDVYFASPRGGHSGEVCVWCIASGAPARAPPAAPAPALAALLPRVRPAQLLVLAGEHLYVWNSRSTAQAD